MSSAWTLAELDAVAQAALVRAGDASPRELAEAALERIDELDPLLGSVVWRMQDMDRQLEQLAASPGRPAVRRPDPAQGHRGPLRRAPQRLGSRFIPAVPSGHDSEFVARLRPAG